MATFVGDVQLRPPAIPAGQSTTPMQAGHHYLQFGVSICSIGWEVLYHLQHWHCNGNLYMC
jgi:hypothetical protein